MALLIGAVAWQLDLEDDRAVRTFDLYLVAWAFLFQNLRGVFCRLLLVTGTSVEHRSRVFRSSWLRISDSPKQKADISAWPFWSRRSPVLSVVHSRLLRAWAHQSG